MENKSMLLKLAAPELPELFTYPSCFDNALANPIVLDSLEPWGFTADSEANAWLSELFHLPLVQFAQAWHEDLVACFIVGNGENPKVVVANPWAQTIVDGEWQETGAILEEHENFEQWLDWVRKSELVTTYAEHRAERTTPPG